MAIDWVIVTDNGRRKVGAVGFIGNKASVIVSFYEDADGNSDGKVSVAELIVSKVSQIGLNKMKVARVARLAMYDSDISLRDPDFPEIANNLFLSFAKGALFDGIYAIYFSRGVSSVAKGISGLAVTGLVKEFAIRKGMEAAVKKAYQAGLDY